MDKTEVAFLGAGKMVSSIVKSLLRTSCFLKNEMICCSAQDGTSEKLSLETGINRKDSFSAMMASNPRVLVLGCNLVKVPNPVTGVSVPQLVCRETLRVTDLPTHELAAHTSDQ